MTTAGTRSGSGRIPARPRPARPLAERLLRLAVLSALAALVVVGAFLRPEPITVLFYLPYALVGAVLVARRPDNPIGWILVVIAYTYVGTTTPANLDMAALQAGTLPFDQALGAWVVGWSGHVGYACWFALAVLFPTGRLPDGRGRLAAVAGLGLLVATGTFAAVAPRVQLTVGGAESVTVPNPIVRHPALEPLSAIPYELIFLVGVGLCVVGIGSMAVRYRRSTGITRVQFRWLGAALTFAVLALAGALVALGIFGPAIGEVVWIPTMIAYPAVPLAVGFAVLRYRLYDIDRLISRTVAYALVTGTLVALFVAGNLVVQTVLADLTAANTIAVAASTLLVFGLAQPVRRRIQWLVDLRFDRSHIDAQQTVRAFADRQRDQVDLTALLDDLRGTAAASVRPESTNVWLRGGDRPWA